MSPPRLWAPFLIGFVGGAVLAVVSIPIARYFGVVLLVFPKLDLYSGMAVLLVTGPAIGFVAAGVSRTLRGLLTLLLGFASAGTALGLIWVVGGVRRDPVNVALESALYVTLVLGLLAVPTYLTVIGIVHVTNRLRGPTRPERR